MNARFAALRKWRGVRSSEHEVGPRIERLLYRIQEDIDLGREFVAYDSEVRRSRLDDFFCRAR